MLIIILILGYPSRALGLNYTTFLPLLPISLGSFFIALVTEDLFVQSLSFSSIVAL